MKTELAGIVIVAASITGCTSRHIAIEPIHYQSTIDITATGAPIATIDSPLANWFYQNVYGPDTITGQSFSGATLYFSEFRMWPRSREQIVHLLAKRKLAHDKIVNAETYDIQEIAGGIIIQFTEPGRPAGSIELQSPEIKENEPNKAMEPMPTSVTDHASACSAPAIVMAHL